MKLIIAVLCGAVLAGCAQPDKTVELKIHTIPEGAVISSRGNNLGISPTVGEVHVSDSEIAAGKAWNTVTAVWKSGATITQDIYFTWTPGDRRGNAGVVVRRPDNAPGL